MKKLYFKFYLIGILSLFWTGLSFGQIISQYVDTDSGITPKGIEIWNNTSSTLDFSTNNLVIERYNNGGSSATTEATISTGTLNAGEVLVIGGSDLATWMSSNYPSVTFINDPFTFNGNDALEVIYGGTRTDVFGTIGQDPGSSWNGGGVSTEDSNIELLSSINIGTTTGFTDPSTRFEVAEADPSILTGFGVAPTNAGITLGTVLGNTTEVGGTATFTVVLDAQPATDVVLDVTSADTGEVIVSPATLTFTNANWDAPQTVTATGQDDALTDGDIAVTIDVVVDDPISDNAYDGLSTSTTVINEDDEGPTLLYDADFSNNGDGFADHTTSSPPAPGPASVGPFGTAPNQWSLSYTTAPNSDATNNSFSIDGGALISDDWGGQGVFESQVIDVSAINSIDITALSTIQGANDNDFVYFYILDGNPRVETVINFSGLTDGDPINYSITSLDVSTNSTLVVGFEFNENGLGNGYETTSFLVEGIPAASTTYTYDNGWNTNPVGVSTSADDIEVVNGTAVISGILIGNNLTVSSGAILDLDSSSVLEIDGNITNDGTILFRSNATSSAQLEAFNGTTSGTGNVTVERYIPANRAYRLLTASVNNAGSINSNWQEGATTTAPGNGNPNPGFGTHITGGPETNGFDQNGSGASSMFTFDNLFPADQPGETQEDAWSAVDNTLTTNLSAGVPYLTFVRGDRSIDLTINNAPASETRLRATGEIHTGPLTFDLSQEHEFYSLVGNPYQAVVDFNLVDRDDLTDFIYVWDTSIGTRGAYVSVELPAGNNTIIPPIAGSSDASQYIPPGASFFVENLPSGSAEITAPFNPSLTFNEDDKATGENEVTIFNTYPHFLINSRLYKTNDLQNGNTESDALGLRFSDEFTTAANNEDATKLFNPDENYAVVNNGLRSIDKQGIPVLGHEVDLFITNYQDTNYSLTFVMENKPAGLGVFIVDDYMNTQTELSDSFVYDFIVDTNIPESIAEDRFSLVFDNTTLGVDDNVFGSNFRVFPNPSSDGQFSISTPSLSGEVTVEMTNLLGQNVYSKELPINGTQVNVEAPNLTQGIYVVKLSQGNQSFTAKLMVE